MNRNPLNYHKWKCLYKWKGRSLRDSSQTGQDICQDIGDRRGQTGTQVAPMVLPTFYLLAVSASLFSFDLQSEILASLFFLALQLAHWLSFGLPLWQFGSEFPTQLTSDFPNFKFPGSDICIGPVKSNGQSVQLRSGIIPYMNDLLSRLKGCVWCYCSERDDPSTFSQVPLYCASKHSFTYLSL